MAKNKYILLCAGEPEQLVAMINEHMEQNYEPAGSVWEGRRGYCQGMILKEHTKALYMGEPIGPGNRPEIPAPTWVRKTEMDVPF